MRILHLPSSGRLYTANAWLVLGDWSRLGDINTLVDVGRDPAILDAIRQASTGVGKRKVDRVVLTHSHYDHVELLPRIRAEFAPEICGYEGTSVEVDRLLQDGERLVLGDQEFEVVAAHSHTSDSICLFNPQSGALFSGDAPLLIHSAGGTYEPGFVRTLRHFCRREIRVLYPGHGPAVREGCNTGLRTSLEFVRASFRHDPGNQKRIQDEVVH